MSGKSINFDDEKINESNFDRKKLFKTDDTDVDKTLVSKKNHMLQKIH